jgi:hypothetical protein
LSPGVLLLCVHLPLTCASANYAVLTGVGSCVSMYDGFTLPQASWIVLLSIAHRYEFLNVRERAIHEIYDPFRGRPQRWDSVMTERKEQEIQKELEQHDYQLLISVGEKYEVPIRYIVPLLLPFMVRKQPLTEGEVLRFSALTMSRLAHAREDYQRGGRVITWGATNTNVIDISIVYKIWQVQNDG